MKIAFITLGCKLNFAETATYERGFRDAGLEVVPWREKADIYLINTCTVTETSNSKSRGEIRKVHRINPDARIIVTGCYAQMKPDEIRAIPGVSRVFLSTEKSLVVPETLESLEAAGLLSPEGLRSLRSLRPLPTYPSRSDDRLSPSGPSPCPCPGVDRPSGGNTQPASAEERPTVFGAYSTSERTRAFLKVQDGCDYFCRYCTIPYARGRSRSIPICEAVKAAEAIAAEGVKEVVITGINTGDYGRGTGESFLQLLKALNEVKGIERWRISSIEPNLITEEIIDWIASGTKFQPHFHIPLQQGTDLLLAKMGRKYTTAFFADRIAYIRSKMEGPGKPKVFFGFDVMAGLPGETDELFEQELEFLEKIRPAFIHVFPYSKRPGTPAATMDGQVPEKVKAERVKKLEELCDRLHSEFTEQNRGIAEKVLFESKEKDGSMGGYTGNYIRISRPYDPALVGVLTDIII
ncbi:MAG: tRNA (N(6)-L-threonylcarbamoyladenosine(37)-C(2))-methylthiotransferase MtaB [Bacteroidales bacterium]|nr:tRNA (N(6)-L-threonylcarbamoyladenosine(37)-C(2))-methylthiotransferase MtaB [Bacteroidales bacterium]